MTPNIGNLRFTLIILTLLRFSTAFPTNSLSNLKCRCISYTSDSRPGPCDSFGSQSVAWHSARLFAWEHDIPIQIASQSTLSIVLEAEQPLPTSFLLRMSSQTLPPSDVGSCQEWLDGTTRVVCEVADKVGHTSMGISAEWKKCEVFALQVAVAFIFMVVLFEAVEVAWNFIQQRFFPEPPIRLSGEEKSLTAGVERETHLTTDSERTTASRFRPSSCD